MQYKTVHEEYKDGPFDVKVWYAPEFVPLADLFDDTVCDIKEMEQKVDSGNASWFVAGVDYYYQGHEVGTSSVGGFYYEEWEEDALNMGLDGALSDIKDEAKESAIKEISSLKDSIQKDFAHA
jgi:hypothetical protein